MTMQAENHKRSVDFKEHHRRMKSFREFHISVRSTPARKPEGPFEEHDRNMREFHRESHPSSLNNSISYRLRRMNGGSDPGPRTWKRTRILVISREPGIEDNLMHTFDVERYQVETAAGHADGFSLIEGYNPHLIILVTGDSEHESLELLRSIRERWEMPVIMLSNNPDAVSLANALACGADDYLTLPFSGVELRARVRAKLRRAEAYSCYL